MSKKKFRKQQKVHKPQKRGSKKKSLAVVALILCMALTGVILAQWRTIRSSFSSLAPVPTPSPTAQLSKEYVYAGGKLIATEEPNNGGGTSPLSPPSALTAAGSSAPQINLTWTASTGGTVNHYRIERMQSFSSGYTVLRDNVIETNYVDTEVAANSAYLYRVRAVDSSNNLTNYSNIDLAIAMTFDNDPLVSYAQDHNNATPIRAVHFTQLREAINGVRRLVDPNIAPFNWTTTNNPPPQVGGSIYSTHLNDLRTNLSDALAALGFARPQYTSPDPLTSGQPIKAIYLQELRELMK